MSSAPIASPKRPATAPDTVVCAIGDIHGRLDLTAAAIDVLRRIARQAAAQGKSFMVVFLGDYIDRGPDSRGVVSSLLAFAREGGRRVVFLRGNHEQVFLDVIEDGLEPGQWIDFGGMETLRSYGIDIDPSASPDQLGQRLRAAIPAAHLDFFRATDFCVESGDYLFVHAGLRPDRLLEEQSEADMLWFRYYADERPVHGRFVVHGHSTHARPINGKSRIAIDTEAYASGALTILRLEDEDREFIKVRATEGGDPEVGPWEGIDASYGARTRTQRRPAVATAPQTRKRKPRSAIPIMVAVCGVVALLALGGVFVGGRLVSQAAHQPKPPAPRPAAGATLARDAATGGAVSPDLRVAEPSIPAAKTVAKDAPPAVAQASETSSPTLRDGSVGATGVAKVQVGSFPTAALAKGEFDALTRALPAQMGSKALEVETAVVGGRTFHRANVTGFTALDQAIAFCRAVEKIGKPCLVKPSK